MMAGSQLLGKFPAVRGGMVRVAAAVAFGLLVTVASAAQAQAPYPSKPIRLVVGFAAGGPSDIIARVIGAKLSESSASRSISRTAPAPPGTSRWKRWRMPNPTAIP